MKTVSSPARVPHFCAHLPMRMLTGSSQASEGKEYCVSASAGNVFRANVCQAIQSVDVCPIVMRVKDMVHKYLVCNCRVLCV